MEAAQVALSSVKRERSSPSLYKHGCHVVYNLYRRFRNMWNLSVRIELGKIFVQSSATATARQLFQIVIEGWEERSESLDVSVATWVNGS